MRKSGERREIFMYEVVVDTGDGEYADGFHNEKGGYTYWGEIEEKKFSDR